MPSMVTRHALLVCLVVMLPLRAEKRPTPALREEIVVTPERAESERDDVAASVTVLTREEIELLPAQSLAEVLDAVPGMTMYFGVAGAGAPMVTARGFFGGGEVEYVKLLVDGAPAADPESGLIDWRHVRTSEIDRIEVLRGPGSSLYGDTAMGGVIQVFTRDAGAGSGGELRLSAGTFGTRAADLFHGSDIGAFRLAVTALLSTAGGYRAHASSRASGGEVTLRRFGDAARLQISASTASTDREEPGPIMRGDDPRSSDPAFRFDRERTVRRRAALTYDRFGSIPLRVVLHGATRRSDAPRTLLLAPRFGSTLHRSLDTGAIGATAEIAREWSRGSLRAGTDLERASIDNAYRDLRARPLAAIDARRVQRAFFATGDWQATPRLRFSAGLRHDAIRDEPGGSPNRKSAWSPRAGLTMNLGPAVAFLQLARAFKAPTVDQLFDPRPFPAPGGATFTISNRDLLPQRARNAEIGIRGSSARAAWSASAYRMDVTDEIDFDPTHFTYENIGRSRHTGVEAVAELRGRAVTPVLTYAWTEVESAAHPGRQLKNIPEHVAQLIVRARLFSLTYRWEHGRFLDDEEAFPLGDVHVVNAKLARTLGDFRIEGEVHNLLGAEYHHVGYLLPDFTGRAAEMLFPAAGRTARVNVIWRY